MRRAERHCDNLSHSECIVAVGDSGVVCFSTRQDIVTRHDLKRQVISRIDALHRALDSQRLSIVDRSHRLVVSQRPDNRR